MSEELYQSWVEQHTEDVYHYFRCHLKLSVEQSETLTHQALVLCRFAPCPPESSY